MIRLELEGSPTAAERWAFELLVDLARLLPLDSASPGGIRAVLTDPAPGQPAFSPSPGSIWVSRSALHRIVGIAGAGEEQRTRIRDQHGRVPASANPLVQAGKERQLEVHQTAEALCSAVVAARDGLPVFRLGGWPEGRGWAAAFTHDLDVVGGWPLFAMLRWGELLGKREFARTASAVGSAMSAAASDPVLEGVESVLALEREAGVRGSWYVLAGTPSLAGWRKGDITYRLDGPRARRFLELILAGGHEVGLHGSFETRDSAELMGVERQRVGRATGKAPEGVRQHFLRFDPGHTLAGASRAGFRYDSSYGFADRNGFRLGVADVLPLWQDSTGQPLPMLEAPLCWMDRALSKYQKQEDPDRWVADALALAAACREVGGLWVGLWHPNMTPALGFPGALPALRRLIEGVTAHTPFVAPLAEIVAWRAARRGLRGRAGAEGRVELISARPGSWGLVLEELSTGTITSHSWPEPTHA